MKSTSGAVLRTHTGPFSIENITLRDLKSDEILVRLVGAGICHTDSVVRTPGLPTAPPVILGHEGAGVVEEVGSDVDAIVVGDHVVLTFDACYNCENCRSGLPSHCSVARNMFASDANGTVTARDADGEPVAARWFNQSSFARHAIATPRSAIVVDKSLPLSILGTLGCGFMTGAAAALNVMKVRRGSRIAVFGVGAVGLAAIMTAKGAGAETILAVDVHQRRLDLASEMGATATVLGGQADLLEDLKPLVGPGLHAFLDTSGQPSVVATGLALLQSNGIGAAVASNPTAPPLELKLSSMIGKTLTGVKAGDCRPHEFIPKLIQLWQDGEFPFDRLIKTFPFAEINAAEAASLDGSVVKPVLVFE
jgi:aryl-alcohol dehydrogenase